jgi:hypothetical protein
MRTCTAWPLAPACSAADWRELSGRFGSPVHGVPLFALPDGWSHLSRVCQSVIALDPSAATQAKCSLTDDMSPGLGWAGLCRASCWVGF